MKKSPNDFNWYITELAISYGSAWSSGSSKASLALLETGMEEHKAKNTVRISIGKFICKEDIVFLVKTINKVISPLMKRKSKLYV